MLYNLPVLWSLTVMIQIHIPATSNASKSNVRTATKDVSPNQRSDAAYSYANHAIITNIGSAAEGKLALLQLRFYSVFN